MKHLILLLVTFLLAGVFLLVSGTPSAVRADEPVDEPNEGGLEVQIVINGDGSIVGVTTIGSSQIFINGTSLNALYAIGADGTWARYEIAEVIFPWMNATEARLTLTADGLAKVILVVQAHDSAIAGAYDNLNYLYGELGLIGTLQNEQGQEITKLEEQILAYEYEAYCLSEYVADLQDRAETTDRNILILVSVSGLIFLCLVISLLRLRASGRAC